MPHCTVNPRIGHVWTCTHAVPTNGVAFPTPPGPYPVLWRRRCRVRAAGQYYPRGCASPIMSTIQHFVILVLIYFMLVALYYQVRHYPLRYPTIVKAVLILCFLGWGALLFDCIQGIMTNMLSR